MGWNDRIAIIGIVVTFLVSVANLLYSLRTNKRTMFVNTVTASRLKWIDSLRDKVSEFIAVTTRLAHHSNSTENWEELLMLSDTLLHQIALHLNPGDPEDQRIHTLAEHAQQLAVAGTNKKELSDALYSLREATGTYLKKEWNRVKSESRGRV